MWRESLSPLLLQSDEVEAQVAGKEMWRSSLKTEGDRCDTSASAVPGSVPFLQTSPLRITRALLAHTDVSYQPWKPGAQPTAGIKILWH